MWSRKLEFTSVWVLHPSARPFPESVPSCCFSSSSLHTIISASLRQNFPSSSIMGLVSELIDDLPYLFVYYFLITKTPLRHPCSPCVHLDHTSTAPCLSASNRQFHLPLPNGRMLRLQASLVAQMVKNLPTRQEDCSGCAVCRLEIGIPSKFLRI